jgi:hypothetical protein
MLIASVTPRRHDGGEFIEIKFDDGLQGGGSGSVAEAVRQGVVPDGVFGLQGEQSSDSVLPALRAGAPVDRPPIADDGRRPRSLAASTIARLAFGVAEWVLTFGMSASWHGGISVT